MTAAGRSGCLLAALLACATTACDSSGELFPANGSVRLQVQDSGLVFQSISISGFQVTTWVITSATIDIDGFGTFDFLQGKSPCVYTDNVIFSDDFVQSCGGSGLVLARGAGTGTVHLTIESVEVRRAVFPDLPPDGDHDGDGLLNRYDNCPLVSNPGQEDANLDGAGDACSILGTTADSDIPDSDLDEVTDVLDNCQLRANPDQLDSFRGSDFIGDACEQFTQVVLPEGTLRLDFPVDFVVTDSALTLFVVDFDNRSALSCNSALTECRIEPAGIRFSTQNG